MTRTTLTQMLARLTGESIDLSLDGTDRRPLMARRVVEGKLTLTLHPCFLLASEETLRHVASHLRSPSRETANALLQFVRAAKSEVPSTAPRRRPRLSPIGKHHDLAEICKSINCLHFGGRLRTGITWGKAAQPRRSRRRSIIFGSYDVTTDTVRIHPDLDATRVPRYFIEYIVHHELLHAVHPVQILPSGRRIVHTPAFNRAERQIPQFERAMAFLKRWRGEQTQPRTD